MSLTNASPSRDLETPTTWLWSRLWVEEKVYVSGMVASGDADRAARMADSGSLMVNGVGRCCVFKMDRTLL